MAGVLGPLAFFRSNYLEFRSPVLVKPRIVSPEVREVEKEEVEDTNEEENTDQTSLEPASEVFGGKWQGIASYYSRDGCIGCHPQMIMANGQPLVDSAKTLAFNHLPLGTMVRVRNLDNDMIVEAEVTDTGGFERLDRIADLTIGTKQAIGCGDLCRVEIKEVN